MDYEAKVRARTRSARRETRELAAILVADVVGYSSQFAGAHEERAPARLLALRSALPALSDGLLDYVCSGVRSAPGSKLNDSFSPTPVHPDATPVRRSPPIVFSNGSRGRLFLDFGRLGMPVFSARSAGASWGKLGAGRRG